ncbi:MAG TPA: hypothetical protein GX401_01475 [Clostridiales bacterium]|nr:hypothetical protein [Clostridiales bacterium]
MERECPHCGAPLQITSSGKCEYCGSIVTTGEFDWVLSDLDSVREDMSIINDGVIISADAQQSDENINDDTNNINNDNDTDS